MGSIPVSRSICFSEISIPPISYVKSIVSPFIIANCNTRQVKSSQVIESCPSVVFENLCCRFVAGIKTFQSSLMSTLSNKVTKWLENYDVLQRSLVNYAQKAPPMGLKTISLPSAGVNSKLFFQKKNKDRCCK